MTDAQARNAVVVGGVVCAIAIVAGAASRGELPAPRRLLAGGVVFVALAALADTNPRLAGPTTGLVTVAIVLANGGPALDGITKAATSTAKLGSGVVPRRGAPAVNVAAGSGGATGGAAAAGTTPGIVGGVGAAGGAVVAGAIAGSPVPGIAPHAATHETAGLAGYPAYDYMAPAGTRVVAPVDGTISRLSGKDPRLGGPPGGALGYSIYIAGSNGRSYFLTHIDRVSVRQGQRVRQGEQIAVVAAGPPSWSSPHVHMGIHG